MKDDFYDAIIVLSHEMDIEGNLDLESSLRAEKAADIYALNNKAKIITCGWDYIKNCDIKICDAMANYLCKYRNIPNEFIIKEYKSRDTVGDAVFTRRDIIQKKYFKKIAVVTSSYHIKRTKEIFEFVYDDFFILDFYDSEYELNKKIIDSENQSLQKFRKTFLDLKRGDIKNIYLNLLQKHSLYNGDIFLFNE